MSAPDYIFAISDRDDLMRRHGSHALIAQRLQDGGFDVGPMLWTAHPHDYDKEEIRAKWQEAFDRAGISRVDWGHDPVKLRT